MLEHCMRVISFSYGGSFKVMITTNHSHCFEPVLHWYTFNQVQSNNKVDTKNILRETLWVLIFKKIHVWQHVMKWNIRYILPFKEFNIFFNYLEKP